MYFNKFQAGDDILPSHQNNTIPLHKGHGWAANGRDIETQIDMRGHRFARIMELFDCWIRRCKNPLALAVSESKIMKDPDIEGWFLPLFSWVWGISNDQIWDSMILRVVCLVDIDLCHFISLFRKHNPVPKFKLDNLDTRHCQKLPGFSAPNKLHIFSLPGAPSNKVPSWELTYPPTQKGTFKDDCPFPQVGYFSSLEGTLPVLVICPHVVFCVRCSTQPAIMSLKRVARNTQTTVTTSDFVTFV